MSHLDLLSTIVKSDDQLEEKFNPAIAFSIRIDGSIDRTQIDKMYSMLKIVTQTGEIELYFFGIGHQTGRGAIGLFRASKNGIIDNIGEDMYKNIIRKLSSICTDGTNVNSGEKRLWKLCEDELREEGSTIPLLKI